MDNTTEIQPNSHQNNIGTNSYTEIPATSTKISEINPKKLFLAGHGGLGDEIGRGREKTARTVGTDKVLITYHGEENQKLATAEYTKAQYYMHKILHEMLPNNFPDIFAGGDDSVLVERIPDTEDFIKAKKINALYLDPKKHHLITPEQRNWWQQKTRETRQHPEYQQAIAILQALGLGYGKDEDPVELAQPVNTVTVDGHPVLLEIMKPIVTNQQNENISRMNIEELAEVVRQGVEGGFLEKRTQNRVLQHAIRYQENAQLAAKSAADKHLTVY